MEALKEYEGRDDVEKWEAVESTYLEMLETKGTSRDERKAVLKLLATRFPGSRRVSWLTLLDLEADGLDRSAFEVYSKMAPTEALARKRIISMHIKEGNVDVAIEELCKYLDTFLADVSAWRQLQELYAQTKQFAEAVFCSEEVVLAYPKNSEVLCRHAELVLHNGDVSLARKYYCLAAEEIYRAKEEESNREGLTKALLGIRACVGATAELNKWVESKLAALKID